jgi:hypothetical protein
VRRARRDDGQTTIEWLVDRYGADSPEYRGVDEAFRGVGLDGTWKAPG